VISTRRPPVRVLVMPEEYQPDLAALAAADDRLPGEMISGAHRVAADEGVGETGCRVVNTGSHAGQAVPDVHGHVLGGRSPAWPPG